MLIHEQYRKCVTFLCLPDQDEEWRPVGSAFHLAYPVSEKRGLLYLVTARHVVEGARSRGPLYARLNQRDSNAADYVELPQDGWHVSQETDLAVRVMSSRLADDFDIEWLKLSQVATRDVLDENDVGPGDETFFSGLFTSFPGLRRAEPVIRFGNISMMPQEPVPISNADGSVSHIEAFLLEARSWGGQSGSPAFVFFPATRHPGYLTLPSLSGAPDPGDARVGVPESARPLLLGLVSGHFDLNRDVAFAEDIESRAQVALNTGIAVVVPAQRIVDLLEEDVIVEERDQIVELHGSRN